MTQDKTWSLRGERAKPIAACIPCKLWRDFRRTPWRMTGSWLGEFPPWSFFNVHNTCAVWPL